MRVLILAADASSNSLVRLYPIAKVLARGHEVHVAGFRSKSEVFGPYASELQVESLQTRKLPSFLRQVSDLASRVSADLVYAFKPVSTSLWTGLELKRRLGVPLLLDIEDWELGWYLDRSRLDQAKHARHVRQPNGMLWTAVNERLIRRVDHCLVVSRFLQRRFGGTLLRHGPDTARFDPARWPREEALERLGLPEANYVAFTGTPMPNKGLEDLLRALERLGRNDTRLLLVGSHAHDPDYYRSLIERWGRWITPVGPRPHAEMPLFLAAATLVALPQWRTRETTAQVPGKVFEAMAMARPVVATAVGDLPEVLDGCGLLAPPGDTSELQRGLERVLEDPSLGARLGTAARERCVSEFSWDAMERVLKGTFATLS